MSKECKQKMTGGVKLDLPSLLIMPVQRIPRYNLLLKVTSATIRNQNNNNAL